MGVIDGDDFASYEVMLCIESEDLAQIMNWARKEQYAYDYELTALQLQALEEACSIKLPENLTFFLTASS
jgi:hypothetical protein